MKLGGDNMIHWAATISLSLLLVGGGIFSGLRIVDMTDKIDELESDYATLNSNFDLLTSDYQSLIYDYNSLDSSHHSLQSDYNGLQSDYQLLESDYQSLRSDYNTFQGRISELQYSNSGLQDEIDDLQRLLDQYEKVPHSYYSTSPFSHHLNTRGEFFKFLTSEFILPRGYEENVFDCSESAAYVEWALENAGFDAYIAVGPTPWDPTSGYHAWVIVDFIEYGEKYRVAIEATALTGGYHGPSGTTLFQNIPSVVVGNNYYEGYDDTFQNIYQAIRQRVSVEEWNWWEGYWGFL